MEGFKHFGVMVDVSRNGVLNKDEFIRFVDIISNLGYDTLELYSEDIYEVEGETYFGYLRGSYSIKELQEFDDYCQKKGIELIPCIQTLAHFTNPSKEKEFAPLLDIDDIMNVDDPKVYEFIDRLISSCRKAFSSKHINIGMDEAYKLGLGKHLQEKGYEPQSDIMIRHLKKVTSICEKYGFDCHMWGDMFVRMVNDGHYLDKGLPSVSKLKDLHFEMPKNLEVAYWDYSHEDVSFYDGMFEFYHALGRDIWFAGAGYTWVGFAPQNKASFPIMEASFRSMKKNKVENYLLTLWGDNGKDCSINSALPLLVAASEMAKGNYDIKEIGKKFNEKLGLSLNDFLSLDDVNKITVNGKRECPINAISKGLLYQDPLMGVLDIDLEKIDFIDYQALAKSYKEAKERNKEYGYLFDTLANLSEFLSHKAYLGIALHKAYKNDNKDELKECLKEIDLALNTLPKFIASFKEQWMRENKAFGFEIQCARLGGVKERLNYAKEVVEDYLEGKLKNISELEAELLPFYREEGFRLNNYRWFMSTSEI